MTIKNLAAPLRWLYSVLGIEQVVEVVTTPLSRARNRRERLAAGLSRRRSRSYYGPRETGRRRPDPKLLVSMARSS